MKIRLPSSRLEWQRATVLFFIIVPVVTALVQSICIWPKLPIHAALSEAKYAERMSLLKYFISLGSSAIAATWYVTSNTKSVNQIYRISLSYLTWAWTCLGISLLGAIVEIYLTYKDFHYWSRLSSEGYANIVHQLQHPFSLHLLHLSYWITDCLFFSGWVLLILAVIGTGRDDRIDKDVAETADG